MSNEAGFTPAPWRWERRGTALGHDGAYMKGFVGADGQGFAFTVGLSAGKDEANANLICAAPDLYEACKWAMQQLPTPHLIRGQNDAYVAAHQFARAALAKANGTEQKTEAVEEARGGIA